MSVANVPSTVLSPDCCTEWKRMGLPATLTLEGRRNRSEATNILKKKVPLGHHYHARPAHKKPREGESAPRSVKRHSRETHMKKFGEERVRSCHPSVNAVQSLHRMDGSSPDCFSRSSLRYPISSLESFSVIPFLVSGFLFTIPLSGSPISLHTGIR